MCKFCTAQWILLTIPIPISGTKKVLYQTSVGRKTKLSTYRSRNDIYIKKHKVISQKNSGFEQNYTKLIPELTDKDVDILGDTASSDNANIVDELTDIEGFDHLPEKTIEDNFNSRNESFIESKSYRDEALEKLRTTNLINDLTELLSDSGQLKDFMDLLEHIRSKSIPCTNIVFVLMLERVRFQSCKNTVGMRYSELTKKFWSIVYRLCKGIGLKFFSGEKNWGQVVNKKARKVDIVPRIPKLTLLYLTRRS